MKDVVIQLEEHSHQFKIEMEEVIMAFEIFVLTGSEEEKKYVAEALVTAANELTKAVNSHETASLGWIDNFGEITPMTVKEQQEQVANFLMHCDCEH